MQARQLNLIAQFTTNIIHIAEQEKSWTGVVPKTLSRINAIQVLIIIITEELSTEQVKDEELQEFLKGESDLELKEFTLSGSTTLLRLLKRHDTTLRPRNSEEMNLRRRGMAHLSAELPNIKSDKNSLGLNRDITHWAHVFSASVTAHQKHIQEDSNASISIKSIWISSPSFEDRI